MTENKFEFSYEVYRDISELNEKDAWLLNEAKAITEQAYAPYSNFNVGAAALLENGEVVMGTKGTLIIEREVETMLFKDADTSTRVNVRAEKGGVAVLDTQHSAPYASASICAIPNGS